MKSARKHSRKTAKKHITKKGKKSTKKRNNLLIWTLLAAAAVLAIIFLVYSLSGGNRSLPEKKVFVENISTGSTDKGGDIVTFYVRNEYDVAADCAVNYSLGNRHESWDIGMIEPHSAKKVEKEEIMPPGKSRFTLEAHCQPIYRDMAGLPEDNNSICNTDNLGGSISQCMGRENADKFFCIALITQNISYCDCINNQARKTLCSVYLKNNPELCEQLAGERDWCYLDYALNKKDRASCEKVNDEGERKSCLAVVTGDLDLCLSLDEDNKFECIVHLAPEMHNKSLCEQLANKDACYDELSWLK